MRSCFLESRREAYLQDRTEDLLRLLHDRSNGFVQCVDRRVSESRHQADHAFLPVDRERDAGSLVVVTEQELVDVRMVLVRLDDHMARELHRALPRFDLDPDPLTCDTRNSDEPE